MFIINNLIKNKNISYFLQDIKRFICDKKFYKIEIYKKNELVISLKMPKNEIKYKTCNKEEKVSEEIKKKNFEDFFRGYKNE